MSRKNRKPPEIIIDRPPVVKITPFKPLNLKQKQYLQTIEHNIITICTGPAGTGKSFVPLSYAAEKLVAKEISKIIITRPAIDAEDDNFGSLPGELTDKYEPYFSPCRDILLKRLGEARLDYYLRHNIIEALPVRFARGKTFDNAIVIIDEAQNLRPKQVKLLITRVGSNCRMIFEGDETQKDIEYQSGLTDARLRLQGIPGIGFMKFHEEDIVRNPLIRAILKAYEKNS